MKFAIRLLLISAVAVGPWGCNRGAPNESVSASNDQTQRTEETQPAKPPKPARRAPATAPAPAPAPAPAAPQTKAPTPAPAPAPAPKVRTVETVPSGTALTVTLAEGLSTDGNKEGDKFSAHLTQPIVVNGKVVADKGDLVTGRIKKIEEPGRVKGRARLELVLNQVTTSHHTYDVSTEPFIVVAGSNKDRDAAIIAGGAGVGAIIGAVTGGGKGAALGAIIGGGSGTTAVLLTQGDQLKLEPETRVNFVLSKDVDLPVIRTTTT